MKKRFDLFFLASLLLTACMTSCSDSTFPEPPHVEESTEVAPINIKLELNKGDISVSRATQPSSMRPITSWKDIKHMMLLLYVPDNGSIRWAKILTAETFDTLQDCEPLMLHYDTAPIGTFEFVAVANCDPNGGKVSQGIMNDKFIQVPNPNYDPNVPGSPQFITDVVTEIEDASFTEANLLLWNKNQLVITPQYTPGKFLPDFYREAVAKYIDDGSYPIRYGIKEPGSIFRGGVTNVVIDGDREVTIGTELERDVALLRIRFNPRVWNTDGLIDFTQNSGIFIGNIPQYMHLPEIITSDGQTSTPSYQPTSVNSIRNAVMSIYDPNGTFKWQDPTEEDGYEFAEGNGTDEAHIVTPEFPLWRDIIVFPTANLDASSDQKSANPYYITISAKAYKGHKLQDGSIMQEDGTVYWSAKIETVFKQNKIYEFNIQLYGGGTYPLPPDPDTTPGPTVNPNPGTTPDPVDPNDPDQPGYDPTLPHGPGTNDPDNPDPNFPDPTNPDNEGGWTDPTKPQPDPNDPNPLYPSRPPVKPVNPVDPGYVPPVVPPTITDGWEPVPGDTTKIKDPETGKIYPKDPETGWPIDPESPDPDNPRLIDPETKEPVDKDPETGWPVVPPTNPDDPTEPKKIKDPETGDIYVEEPDPDDPDHPKYIPVNPDQPIPGSYPEKTWPKEPDGTPWPVDPETGLPEYPNPIPPGVVPPGHKLVMAPDGDLYDPEDPTYDPDPTDPSDPDNPNNPNNPHNPSSPNYDPDAPTYPPHSDKHFDPETLWPIDPYTGWPKDPDGPFIKDPETGTIIPLGTPDNPITTPWPSRPDAPTPDPSWPIDPVTGWPYVEVPNPDDPGHPKKLLIDPDTLQPIDPEHHNDETLEPTPTIKIPGGTTVIPPLAPPASITEPNLPTLHFHNIKIYDWGATRETNVEL
ncbi:MAG: hypothetical protein K2H44_07195 [Muribaculaceae bacterium]|nr:hypothetical protein [Muribaculaceae bacterium]